MSKQANAVAIIEILETPPGSFAVTQVNKPSGLPKLAGLAVNAGGVQFNEVLSNSVRVIGYAIKASGDVGLELDVGGLKIGPFFGALKVTTPLTVKITSNLVNGEIKVELDNQTNPAAFWIKAAVSGIISEAKLNKKIAF